MASNQGSDSLLQVLADVPSWIVSEAAHIMWQEARAHPPTASCECPAYEVLCFLYDNGYKVVPA